MSDRRILKRSRSNSYGSRVSYGPSGPAVPRKRSSIPRSLRSRAINQRPVHPLTGEFQVNAQTDIGISFAFDTLGVYVNDSIVGASTLTLGGLSELSGVYEILRLVKVEFTVLGSFDTLPINNTSAVGLPIGYAGVDFNDNDVPTKALMLQNPRLKTFQAGKPFKISVYPKMEGSNGVVDVGTNQRNLFQQAGVASTQKWHGMKFYFDCFPAVYNTNVINIQFKCFYEGMMAK